MAKVRYSGAPTYDCNATLGKVFYNVRRGRRDRRGVVAAGTTKQSNPGVCSSWVERADITRDV